MGKIIGLDTILKAAQSLSTLDDELESSTKLFHSEFLSNHFSNVYNATINVFPKPDNRTRIVGSFKLRGSAYKMLTTSIDNPNIEEFVGASKGNHSQGMARTAKLMEKKVLIAMPQTTEPTKVEKTLAAGADFVTVKLVGDNVNEALAFAQEYASKDGRVFIHPYDDADVIAGQGTTGLELINTYYQEFKDSFGPLNFAFYPIGGGGLLAGASSAILQACEGFWPTPRIIGVEETFSASMYNAFLHAKPTALDELSEFVGGTAVKVAGELPYEILSEMINIDDLVQVDEQKIAYWIHRYHDMNEKVEPAGILSVAGLDEMLSKNLIDTSNPINVAVEISGGSIGLDEGPMIHRMSLEYQELFGDYEIFLPNKVGQIKKNLLPHIPESTNIEYFHFDESESNSSRLMLRYSSPNKMHEFEDALKESKIDYIKYKQSGRFRRVIETNGSKHDYERTRIPDNPLADPHFVGEWGILLPNRPNALKDLLMPIIGEQSNIAYFHYDSKQSPELNLRLTFNKDTEHNHPIFEFELSRIDGVKVHRLRSYDNAGVKSVHAGRFPIPTNE